MAGLADRLAAARAQVELPPPAHDPDDVRRLADEVLARPEYRRPPPSLWERLGDWVGEQVARALDALSGGGSGQVLAWVVALVIIGGVAVLVVRGRRGLVADPGRPVETVSFSHRAAAEWAEEADALERAGEWRAAVRARYRALLAGLAEAGVLEDRPGRTGREVEAEVRRARPDAGPVVAAATDLFEVVWYGDAPAGPDDAARMADLAGRVVRARAARR